MFKILALIAYTLIFLTIGVGVAWYLVGQDAERGVMDATR